MSGTFGRCLAMYKKNITEIAERAGVSLATVSRVFRNHPNVSPKMREKILNTAHQLNYSPRITAGERSVGLVIESLDEIHSDFYLASMLAYVAQQLSARNLGLELVPISQLDKLQEHFIQSAIAIPYFESSKKLLLKQKRTRFVLINEVADGVSSVGVYHRQGIRLAYEYLFERGHRKIALLQDYPAGWGNSERRLGFQEELILHGVNDDEERCFCITGEALTSALKTVLKEKFTALIISSESTVLRVTRELQQLGVRIPDDLSLISYEHPSISPYLCPAHTTLKQNHTQLVANAIDIAARILDGEYENPMRILVENQLIERDSVKTLK